MNNVRIDSTIGIKKLSKADLGKSSTSNLTHIGLFDGTLNFLDPGPQIIASQLIFRNQTIDLLAILDFIKNPDGTYRSPKIRLGHELELKLTGVRVNSVVREIRAITKDSELEWYLLWFGLDSNELVFFLFSKNSQEFNYVRFILGEIRTRKQLSSSSPEFSQLINYLNEKVENVNLQYYQELEIASQIGSKHVTQRIIPRVRDLEKANKNFKEIGEKGEKLLFEYFKSQKDNGLIRDFKWLNQSKESSMPYDFEITKRDNSIKFSDSKATKFKFEQPIIFSSSELKFIQQNKNNYMVHRVYELETDPKLRICKNISIVSDIFIPKYQNLSDLLSTNGLAVKHMSIAVPTDLENLNFENEISLDAST